MAYETVTPGGRVLVIDDEPSVSKLLAEWLAQMGYCYTFIGNTDDANELLEHTDFDVVLYGHEFRFSKESLQHRLGQKV